MPIARVAVVIPTWNRGTLVRFAAASALAQGPDVDVIVSRSSGDDHAVDALAGLDRVRVTGPSGEERAAARNSALSQVDAEYVLFLDDDDLLAPGCLAALLRAAHTTGADVVRGGRVVIGPGVEHLEAVGTAHRTRPISARSVFSGREILTPSQTLYRRDTLDDDPFEPQFVPIEDFVLGARLAARALRFIEVTTPVVGYRVHSMQSEAKHGADHIAARRRGAVESLLAESVPRSWKRALVGYQNLFGVGAAAYVRGDRRDVLRSSFRSVRADPSLLAEPMLWKAIGWTIRPRS